MFDNVGTINMRNVHAVTDMFEAFDKINKSENVINKFTKSVNEFTSTCKNLLGVLGENTDAINNINSFDENTFTKEISNTNIIESSYEEKPITKTNGIIISNVEEIARTIAEKINGALSIDVPDTQVQLLINGMGGNEWTISRY
jgi:hypothetical protein